MQTLKMDPERAFLLRDGLELDLMKLPLVHTNLIFPGYTVSYLLISFKMPWTAFPSWVTSARQLGGFIYINYIVSLRTQHPLPLFASATSPSHTLAFVISLDSHPVPHNQSLFCFSFWGCFSLRHLSCPFTLFRSLLKGYLFTQLSQQFFGTNPPGCPLLACVIAYFSLDFILLVYGVFTGIYNYCLICL